MRVDPAALLHASNILKSESRELLGLMRSYKMNAMPPRGHDPVSKPAAEGFQTKITAILDQAIAYANNLGVAAQNLVDHAKTYGATDEQAALSFSKFMAEKRNRSGGSANNPLPDLGPR